MSIKIWYQTEEQEFLHAEMQHYFEAVLQMQAEKASEQDADLKVIVEKEDTDMDHIFVRAERMNSSKFFLKTTGQKRKSLLRRRQVSDTEESALKEQILMRI